MTQTDQDHAPFDTNMSSVAREPGRRCCRLEAAASRDEVRSRTWRMSATSRGAAGTCTTFTAAQGRRCTDAPAEHLPAAPGRHFLTEPARSICICPAIDAAACAQACRRQNTRGGPTCWTLSAPVCSWRASSAAWHARASTTRVLSTADLWRSGWPDSAASSSSLISGKRTSGSSLQGAGTVLSPGDKQSQLAPERQDASCCLMRTMQGSAAVMAPSIGWVVSLAAGSTVGSIQ